MEDLIRNVLLGSPYGRLLGIELREVAPDRAVLFLPFRPEVTTVGTIVHGGAIASLIDVAAAVAVWSNVPADTRLRGVTVALTINYLAPGDGKPLLAEATVVNRGKALQVCEVTVRDEAGTAVARALVTYKAG